MVKRRFTVHLYKVVCLLTALAVLARLPGTSLAVQSSGAQGQSRWQMTLGISDPADCHLYPIALSAQTLAGAKIGDALTDILNGTGPGNFGWLTWAGDPSEPALVLSLTPPGNSETYVNPDDPNDQAVSAGDWVRGKPGVSNSKAVREALAVLKTMDIDVPVWDQAGGSGNNARYRVADFARVRLTDFHLPGQNRIEARFLGYSCGSGTPTPTPTSTPTNTPTDTPTPTPTDTPTPTPTDTPTATPTATATSTPTATPTPLPSPLEGGTLRLDPPSAGPNVTGTAQRLTASLQDRFGAPLAGVAIEFTVAGPNATSGAATTDALGLASFTYTGANNGTDSVQATARAGGTELSSNVSLISWVTPVQQISTTTIWGRFFTADNSGVFKTSPSEQPVFDQAFPTINFNPPAGTVPGNTSGVGVNTRPFTDVTTDLNGNFTGTIAAQGKGFQAGVGALFDFAAVFTGEFVVASAGDVTFNFFSDDGFIFSVGNGATRVGGANVNPPASGLSPFMGYPVMGAYNRPTAPVANSITVHFPAPGTYPYEVDYTECCGGQLALTMTTAAAGNRGVPPTGSLTLSPNTVSAKPTGQQQTFTVTAVDASGVALAALPLAIMINGPNGQQLNVTTDAAGRATFSYTGNNPGTDTVQAIAWVSGIAAFSGIVSVPWSAGTPPVPEGPLAVPGWIGSPANQSQASGAVPIRLGSGVSLQTGTIDYWPADDPGAVILLASDVSGSAGATLATLDTTGLANGAYVIRLRGTSTSGVRLNSGVLITVVGEYKPGRVRFSLVDLVVPVVGLPITIGRTYDSLERSRVGDFGHGWSLVVGSPRLETDQAHNVTLTMPNGRRVTFFFTPQSVGGIFGFLLLPRYTPEAGVYGGLTADGCGLLAVSAGKYFCFPGSEYRPGTFTYTDPYGRVFQMGADGALRSIRDLNDNLLTFSPGGIASSAGGLNVAFARDSQGRITRITDPEGNVYQYDYDAAGDLAGVRLPGLAAPIAYRYDPGHLFLSAVDPRGETAVITTYYPDGRLKSETDAAGNTYQYAYDLSTRTTTLTHPDGGVVTTVHDAFGNALRQTDPLGRTRTFAYDSNHQLVAETDPLGHATTYTYDENGNQTSLTDSLGVVLLSMAFNRFGGPTQVRDALGAVRTVSYDARFMPIRFSDGLGPIGGYSWDARGNALAFENGNGETTTFTYDAFGNALTLTDALGHTTTYAYDLLGRRVSAADAEGNLTRFGYDALGRLTSIVDPLGAVSRYEYDANGNLTAAVDPLGRRTGYAYDALNRLTKISYPDGATRTYTSDFRGNMLTETDELGVVTRYEYDLAGQLIAITRAAGTPDESATSMAYDPAGRLVAATDPLGHTTAFAYDAAGRLIRVTDRLGGTTAYAYDDLGQLVSVTDANGHTTTNTYDARGRLIRTTYPDGTSTQQAFDGAGRLISATDQGGRVARYAYDAAGRLVRTTRAEGTADASTVEFSYDAAGRRVSATDPLSHATAFAYDAAGRLIGVTDPLGNLTTYRYDGAGQLASTVDPKGHRTRFGYDSRGRLVLTTFADDTTSARSYDAAGRLLSSADQAGQVTTYAYDRLGRLRAVSNPLGHTAAYGYDPAGSLLSITDANGRRTSFVYDALQRQTRKTWPDGSFEAFSYDPAGNLTAHRLADGNSNTFSYDAMNRLVRAEYFDGEAVAQAYTPTGQRAAVTDGRGTTRYAYDSQDRLIQITSPDGQVISYTYDPGGNRRSMTTPAGTTAYAYDPAGRLASVADPAGGTTTYAYDATGQRARRALPNGVVTEYTYDALNRLTGVRHRLGTSTLASYTYTLDPAGNRLRVEEADGGAIEWSYDDAYRLIGERRLNPAGAVVSQAAFTYDPVGNRLSMTRDGATTVYAYNELDQLTRAGSATFTYDPRGNLVEKRDGPDVARYAYDARDRLSGLTLPDGSTLANAYDADGRRVRQSAGAAVTTYLWDEASAYGDVVLEADGAGGTVAAYVLGGTELLSQARGGATSYYLADGQGSVRALADAAGAVADRYDFTAFGELFARSGSTANPYLYTGQRFDERAGLLYLRARYYDPALGRFLSRDPAELDRFNPVELHRYQYAANNPVNLIDPTGRLVSEEALQVLTSVEIAIILAAWIEAIFLARYVEDLVKAPPQAPPWTVPDISPDGRKNPAPGPPGLGPVRTVISILLAITVALTGTQTAIEGQPEPIRPPEPEPTPEREECNSTAFVDWWWSLDPRLNSYRPGEDWYQYEQRVARASGLYGIYTRTAGPIDADGIEPASCRFVDAKYSADPGETQWRFDGPPWAAAQALDEFVRYNSAIRTPNGIPHAQPQGLIVRTPFEISRPFFENLLMQAGFTIGVDGAVEVEP